MQASTANPALPVAKYVRDHSEIPGLQEQEPRINLYMVAGDGLAYQKLRSALQLPPQQQQHLLHPPQQQQQHLQQEQQQRQHLQQLQQQQQQ